MLASKGYEVKDLPMQGMRRMSMRVVTMAVLLPVIGACSADLSLNNVTLVKPDALLRKPDWTTYSGNKDEFGLRPVTSEDLVGPDGTCAAQSAAVATAGEPVLPPGTPTVQGGIALQMTECDVVRRAGLAAKVDLGTANGERSAVITFTRGPHIGVYRFAGGRLVSIERAPGPDTPAPKQKTAPTLTKRPTGT